jgi:hypothetical protein
MRRSNVSREKDGAGTEEERRSEAGDFTLSCTIYHLRPNSAASDIYPPMASLCFAAAGWSRSSNKISDEAFYGHILAHFRGVWHAADDRDDLYYLSVVDPVCSSLKRMILKPDFKTVQGKITSTSFADTS